MNLFTNYLVLMQFAAHLSNVVSHTVLLRPIKSSNSGFKVPRHEVMQSKILKEATSQYTYKKLPLRSSFFLGERESDVRNRVPSNEENRQIVFKDFNKRPLLTVQNFPGFPPLLLSQTSKEGSEYSEKASRLTRVNGNDEKSSLNQRRKINHKKPWKWPETSPASSNSGTESFFFFLPCRSTKTTERITAREESRYAKIIYIEKTIPATPD